MREIRHHTISDQVGELNAFLRGHYAYYGVAGNIRSLFKVYRAVERYWRKMLCSRSRAGRCLTWGVFNQIKERTRWAAGNGRPYVTIGPDQRLRPIVCHFSLTASS